jgi:hypothetical protein
VYGTEHRHAAAELLVGEQARLDGLGQLHLVFRGQQRHAADFPEVDPDQVAGGGPPAALRVGAPDVGLILPGDVQHLDALVDERAYRRVDGLRRQVGTVKRHHDVGNGQGTPLPP